MWRIVYRMTDKFQPPETVSQGSVSMPTLELALGRLAKRLAQSIGNGIDLRQGEETEQFSLLAEIQWQALPSSFSSGPQ